MKSTLSLIISRAWLNVSAVMTFVAISYFLTPAEFGMFALASSVSLLPHWLVSAGTYEYVLGRDPEGRDDNTAWTLSALSGVAAALVMLGIGTGAYLQFDSIEVFVIFAGFALNSFIWGLGATLEAQLIRDNRGGSVATIAVASETVSLIALLLALVGGAGIYALVVNRLVGGAVASVAFFRATGQPLRFILDRKAAKEILNFGSGIFGTRTVGWANGYGGDLVIGFMLALADVGLFRMGMRIYQAGHAVVLQAPGPAILAAVGRAAAQHSTRLLVVLQRANTLQLALTLPLFAGLAASAGIIVDIALKPQWGESGLVVTMACLSVPGTILLGSVSTALTAVGKSRSLFMLLLVTTPFALLAMVVGAPGGAAMVAGAKGVVTLIYGAASVWLIPQITWAGGARLLAVSGRITLAAAIMFLFCYIPLLLIAKWQIIWLKVPVAGLVLLAGLALYAAMLRLLAPQPYRMVKALGHMAYTRVQAKLAARRAIA